MKKKKQQKKLFEDVMEIERWGWWQTIVVVVVDLSLSLSSKDGCNTTTKFIYHKRLRLGFLLLYNYGLLIHLQIYCY